MFTQNLPVEQQPFLYGYGCIASNDATTPNSVIDMTTGQVRDSNDNIDIVISSAMTINAAINGYNGLDTGSLAANKMYSIFAIADSSNKNPSGFILTLQSNSTPLMPYGYDSYRLVGNWPTDGSAHFLLGYYAGVSNGRSFTYDAPQATAVTAGNATTYTAIDLSNLVPIPAAGVNLPVSIAYTFIPNAAGDTLKLQPANGIGDSFTVTGQVTTVHVDGNISVLAQLKSAKPEINYKVSSGTDSVAIKVIGFSFSI
jgi:hypothetical protein